MGYSIDFTFSLCLVSALVVAKIDAQVISSCSRTEACKCTTNEGGIVDLNILQKSITQPFTATDAVSDSYQWNPCIEFYCITQVLACQYHGGIYYDIGSKSSEQFEVDPVQGLYVSYKAGDQKRSSRVYLKCNEAMTTPTFSARGYSTQGYFEMTMTSKDVCPIGGSSGGGGGESQVGTILVALFFSLLLAYFIFGALFQAFYRKRSGVEIIPSHTFWLTLPGVIKDGFLFVFGRCCKREGYSSL